MLNQNYTKITTQSKYSCTIFTNFHDLKNNNSRKAKEIAYAT